MRLKVIGPNTIVSKVIEPGFKLRNSETRVCVLYYVASHLRPY